MKLKEVEDFRSWEFKEGLAIYESSFPPNETRPVEKVVKMLKEHKDYHLFVAVDNGAVLGISLLYAFRSLHIGLLDYMAVAPNHQRRGIGKELFRFTLQKLRSEVPLVIGLIMEIQKDNVPDPHDHLIRKNRIRFYSDLGARLLDGVNYLLPSQDRGKPEEMYLMMVPLTEMPSLPKRDVIQYISTIYSTIYQYENKDLLNAVFSNLPTTINVRDIVV
jgi:GNAT superfamily N-acetyltransferase